MQPIQVELPFGFSQNHERVVIDYLDSRLRGRAAWAVAFDAFNLLHQAVFVTTTGRFTFRSLFRYQVDFRMAESYLSQS